MASLLGSSESEKANAKAFDLVQNQFGSLPYNCASLDKDLAKLQDAIINAYKMPLTLDELGHADIYQNAYKAQLELKKTAWQSMFSDHNCRDIIENIRLQSMAVTQTSSAITQENSVLGASTANENIYIGIGGLVMLLGLFIVLKK